MSGAPAHSVGEQGPRLLLVGPANKYPHLWNLREIALLMGRRVFSYPLALPVVASLTPSHYRIRIAYEEVEPIPYAWRPDIVGITTMVCTASRAYAIADRFRAMGAKVVLGGPHATFNADEGLAHADAIVVGEAETTWPQCLRDFEAGCLQRVYRADQFAPFVTAPRPRWDLVHVDAAMVIEVQVSRGCPYRCEFCIVSKMFGQKMRYRELDDVMAEVCALPKRQVFFVDDNLTADKAYAHRLMERLKEVRISWLCQATLDVAEEPGLLEEMAEAGCNGMLLGFESINPASLTETRKLHNRTKNYEETIRRVQAAGIDIFGAFVVGFDHDTLDVYENIYRFATQNNISHVIMSTLTPTPGCWLHERMKREGRLIETDPAIINGVYPCMRYRNMSNIEMVTSYFRTLRRLYDYGDLRRKAVAVFSRGAYTRRHRGDVGVWEKARVVATVLREYLFTGNAQKRGLLFDLLRLVLLRKLYIGKAFEYLVFVAANNLYLDRWETYKDEVLAIIRRHDPGPLVGARADAGTVGTELREA